MKPIAVSEKFINALRYENNRGSMLLTDRAGNKWLAGEEFVLPLGPYPVLTRDYVYTERGMTGQSEVASVVHVDTMKVVLQVQPNAKNGIFVAGNRCYFNGENFHHPLDGDTAGDKLVGRITVYNGGAEHYLARDEFITYLYKNGEVVRKWEGAETHTPYFIGTSAIVFNGDVIEFE
jgi:hypothetical protein